jgi:hypothetical protein
VWQARIAEQRMALFCIDPENLWGWMGSLPIHLFPKDAILHRKSWEKQVGKQNKKQSRKHHRKRSDNK